MSYFNLISTLEKEDCIADIIESLRALESHTNSLRLPHDLILFGSRLCQPEFQDHTNLLDAVYRLVNKLPEQARPVVRRSLPTKELWEIGEEFPEDSTMAVSDDLRDSLDRLSERAEADRLAKNNPKAYEEFVARKTEMYEAELEDSIQRTERITQRIAEDLAAVLQPQYGGILSVAGYYDDAPIIRGSRDDQIASTIVEMVQEPLTFFGRRIPLLGWIKLSERAPIASVFGSPEVNRPVVSIKIYDPGQADAIRERIVVYRSIIKPIKFFAYDN